MLSALIASLGLVAVPSVEVEQGYTLRVYEVGRPLDRLARVAEDATPNIDRLEDRIDFNDESSLVGPGGPNDFFAVEAIGFLSIETEGEYVFELRSDDGGRLEIDGKPVIVHDGVHPPHPKEGAVTLSAGLHAFRVDMFENQGGCALILNWKKPGSGRFTIVPPEAFRTEKGVTRVVSAGTKVYKDGRENARPGDGLPIETAHPMFAIEPLRPKGFEPRIGGMAFLPDGRLVVSDFEPMNNGELREKPNGTLFILSNVVGGTPETVKFEKLPGEYHDPSGVVVVDGDIYISHRPGIDRLRDLDHDGAFETHEEWARPWVGDNYHHFSFGLKEKDGWIYGTLSTSIYFGNTIEREGVIGGTPGLNGPNPPHRGTLYRINIKSKDVEWISGGFRTPNGVEVTPSGDVFVSDNQGAWLPASKLVHAKQGRFYGHYNGRQKSRVYPEGGHASLYSENPPSPPAVWLPQNEIANSPTTPLVIRDGRYKGDLWLSELTLGGINRVSLEVVAGELQGCAYRVGNGLEGGVQRIVDGPDGALYAGSIGSGGNWNWRDKRFGLERLRFTGKDAFEIARVSAEPDGLIVSFTRPVADAWLRDARNFTLRQWRYEPTEQYGGPKIDDEAVEVVEAVPGKSGDTVFLRAPGIKAGRVVYLHANPVSTDGEKIWSAEAWYTMNAKPTKESPARPADLLAPKARP
ncbi:MAG: hypothetical protein RLY21_1233 [Planctomycetota bacterium]|jgi:hypothetical protein